MVTLTLRRFTPWAALLACCCTFQSSWGHRQIISSAFIKNNKIHSAVDLKDRMQCLHKEKESIPRSAALNVRGGSSYGNDYNEGYGNYQDGGGDNGKGYNDNDGYYNKNDGYDDRDRGNSPSYDNGGGGGGGRDRYYEEDYGRSGGSGYYDDEGRYHDDYDDRGGRGSSSRLKSKTKLPTTLTSGNRKLGIIFLGSGAAFTILGITLFFNKTLMRLGNLLFVAGVPLMLGPGRTMGYFLQPKKARATGCLGCGVFLVLVGHPVIGILLEIFGLLNLFGNMFPLVKMMAKNLPVVGSLFGGNSGGGGGGGGSSSGKRKESRYDDDRYYEDDGYEREYRRDERY